MSILTGSRSVMTKLSSNYLCKANILMLNPRINARSSTGSENLTKRSLFQRRSTESAAGYRVCVTGNSIWNQSCRLNSSFRVDPRNPGKLGMTRWQKFSAQPLWKKLLAVNGTGLAVILLILFIDWEIQGKKASEEDRKKRLERVGRIDSSNPLYYIAPIPCMRNSILLAAMGGFTGWTVTFLFTSNPKKAWKVLPLSAFALGLSYNIYCHARRQLESEAEETLASAIKNKRSSNVPDLNEQD